MGCRESIAICLVFCLSVSAAAQDRAALNALFQQAAQHDLGGTKQDLAAAIRIYEQAARQGHGPSMVRLGYLHQSGTGIPQDLPGAFALYERAAKTGDLDGQFMYALSYAEGIGTRKDPAAGRKLLLSPADAGHQFAQFALGIMIEVGEGGPKREAAARRWLDKAATGPDRELAVKAAGLRDKIDKNLFAQDYTGTALLGIAAFILLAGAASGGGEGGGASYPSGTGAWPTGGSTTSSSTQTRAIPMPANGDLTRTMHGTDAIGLGRPITYRH